MSNINGSAPHLPLDIKLYISRFCAFDELLALSETEPNTQDRALFWRRYDGPIQKILAPHVPQPSLPFSALCRRGLPARALQALTLSQRLEAIKVLHDFCPDTKIAKQLADCLVMFLDESMSRTNSVLCSGNAALDAIDDEAAWQRYRDAVAAFESLCDLDCFEDPKAAERASSGSGHLTVLRDVESRVRKNPDLVAQTKSQLTGSCLLYLSLITPTDVEPYYRRVR